MGRANNHVVVFSDPSEAPEFILDFFVLYGSCCSDFSFLCSAFLAHCLYFFNFSFGYCVVCSSSIYGF